MLFTQRAAAASGTFELTAANQAPVVDLCRRLDGLPLAIELAATRTRVLAVEQIVDRLTDRFALLTGGSRAALPRHQTLRTTIEWSHDLLPEAERAVLRRLCAFAGRFTLEDVESVCAAPDVPEGQALDLLASLVDKSMVTKEDAAAHGVACYRLHETMREFARLKLAEAGETEAVERRCAEYYRSRCARSAGQGRYRLPEWLAWADLEIDNVRAVLQRCQMNADTRCGLDLATTLGWYWITRATTEGIRWLDEFLARGGDPRAHGWAYFIRGFLAVLKADPAAAEAPLQTAAAVARQTGQRDLLAEALAMAANAAIMAGDRATARRLLDEARSTAADLAYPPGRLAVLQAQSFGGFFEADLDSARTAATEGARLAEQTGDLYALEMMQLNLGLVALMTGRLDESKPLLVKSLRIARQIDDRVAQFYLLGALGCHAALVGQARLAAHLLGAAEEARTEAGADVIASLAPSFAQAQASSTAALGAIRFEAEWQEGKQRGRDGAVAFALGQPVGDARPAPGRTDPLAKRELDVARLVADGLTNKEIGTRLFISERTVDSHVRSILNKLGFGSRAQVAAWIAAPDS